MGRTLLFTCIRSILAGKNAKILFILESVTFPTITHVHEHKITQDPHKNKRYGRVRARVQLLIGPKMCTSKTVEENKNAAAF